MRRDYHERYAEFERADLEWRRELDRLERQRGGSNPVTWAIFAVFIGCLIVLSAL